MHNLRRHYSICLAFFADDLKRITIFMIILFALMTAATAIYIQDHTDVGWEILVDFMNTMSFDKVITDTGELSTLGLIVNNLRACLTGVLLGVIPFLFLPLFALLANAGLVGILIGFYNGMELPAGMLLAGLLPHGIFELPALILSVSMGIYLCRKITRRILRKKEAPIGQGLTDSVRFFACIVVPLLVIAAVIEANITPLIMGAF